MPSFDAEPICVNCGDDLAALGEAYCSDCLEEIGYPACPRCYRWMEATGIFAEWRALLLCPGCDNMLWV